MATIIYVKAAAKDYPNEGIKKGEPYYWWAFRFGGKHRSKTAPKASQLTQSSHISGVLAAGERLGDLDAEQSVADNIAIIEEVIGDLENLKEEAENSHDNMPEGLQDGEVGEMLQERADTLESAISDLEDAKSTLEELGELEVETPTEEEVIGDLGDELKDMDGAERGDRIKARHEEMVEEAREEAEKERKGEVEAAIENAQGVDLGG